MIIRGIVRALKTIIDVIVRVIAWLLVALGLWLPAVFAVLFFMLILFTATPFSSVDNVFYVGLVLTTVISIWLTLASGKKRGEVKKPKAAPTYVSRIREKESKVEYTKAPHRSHIQEQVYDEPNLNEGLESGRVDYNSIKRECLREMEKKYGKSFTEYENNKKKDVRKQEQSQQADYGYQGEQERYGGYDRQQYESYNGYGASQYGSDARRKSQNQQFESYYQGYQQSNQFNDRGVNGQQFESYHEGRDYQGAGAKLNEYRREVQGQQFESYHKDREYQGAKLNEYRREMQGQQFESYHKDRDYHQPNQNSGYGVNSQQFESYNTGRDYQQSNQNSGYGANAQQFESYNTGRDYHQPNQNSGYGANAQQFESYNLERERRNESPRIFLSRKDKGVLIYEYSDRLEYYRKTGDGLIHERTQPKL